MEYEGKYIKELSRLDSKKSLFFIFFEWVLILSMFLVFTYYKKFLLLIVFIPLMATRMYALYSLLHDGVHCLITKNRKLNDFISTVFLALPLFISFTNMRKVHFLHHKHLQTEKDPEIGHLQYEEFDFPLSKTQLIAIFVKDILGYNYLKYRFNTFHNILKNKSLSINMYYVFYYLVIAVVVFKFNIWQEFLLLWILPYITVYQLLNRLRTYFEHFNIPDKKYKIRTFEFNRFFSFFIAPYSLGYHTEHHLYPNVPNYNLRKVNHYIKRISPEKIYSENNMFDIIRHAIK